MKPILRSNLSRLLTLLPLTALWLASGCSRVDHKQSTLDPKGLVAQNQYDVFMLSVWLTIFLFCAVGGCLLFVLWKYRAKNADEAKEVPPQTHGNSKVEGSLIIASAVLLVVLAVPTLQGVVLMNRVPDPNNEAHLEKLGIDKYAVENPLTVNVTGKRFFWVFEYPEYGIVTANELVFPVNRAVRLNLRTTDVIHSFWLPKLAGKMDLMPGQENFMWFIANKEKLLVKTDKDGAVTELDDSQIAEAMPAVHNGTLRKKIFEKRDFTDEFDPVGGFFYGQCAEYCGNSHARMMFRAIAQTESDFNLWVQRFQDAQNSGKLPQAYDPEKTYAAGEVVLHEDESLVKNDQGEPEVVMREYRAESNASTAQTPSTATAIWKPAHSDLYERGKFFFTASKCNECHAVNRVGLEYKGPNLTLFGLRASLAAGWMRNDKESLAEWLKNSNDIKFGNLMWNGEGVDDEHPLRKLREEKNKDKVNALVAYLLEQD